MHVFLLPGRRVTTWDAVGRAPKSRGWMGPVADQVPGGDKIPILGACGPHVSSCPAWQDTERFQARSQELEQKLFLKEQELEQLIQKQKRVGFCPRPQGTALALAYFSCHSLKDFSFNLRRTL